MVSWTRIMKNKGATIAGSGLPAQKIPSDFFTKCRKQPSMRIAVLSDTHDELPRHLPAKLRGAQEIWHLGDVVSPRILKPLEKLGIPLRLVRGNCDGGEEWPLSLTMDVEGVLCHLVHIPPLNVPAGLHLVLHGHTHIPRDETDPLGLRWLNPGSASQPRGGFKPSFAWLVINKGSVERFEVVPVS
jgi:putative phosphoesterase